jgi:hypothetical protein
LPGWDNINRNEGLKMSDNERCEVVDIEDVRAEKELDRIKGLLANLHKNEDELLAGEKEYLLAYTQLSKAEQEAQGVDYMDFLKEIERIKRDRGLLGIGRKPSKDLWMKMMAAFEANDVETLEKIEKELLQ